MPKKQPKMCDYWCVVDYEERFILVQVGVCMNDGTVVHNGSLRRPDDQIIVHTGSGAESFDLWDKYHDKLHFEPAPFANVNAAIRDNRRRRAA